MSKNKKTYEQLSYEEWEKLIDEIDNLLGHSIKCECGSKHTSNTKWHYSWCPIFKKQQEQERDPVKFTRMGK